MGGGGFVYGSIVPETQPPSDISISESGRISDAAVTPTEFILRCSHGCRLYEVARNGKQIGSFWLSTQGSYTYRGRTYGIGPISVVIFGMSRNLEGAGGFFQALSGLAHRLGMGRLLIFCEKPLADGPIRIAGLAVIGRFGGRMRVPPDFALLCSQGRPLSGLRCALRKRFSSLASLAFETILSLGSRRYILSGRCADRSMKVAYFGPEQYARFYSGIFFDKFELPFMTGRLPWPEKEPFAGGADVSITVSPFEAAKKSKDAMLVPVLVRSVLGVGRSFDDYSCSLPSSAQHDLKKIAKAGFSYEISRDPLDFLLFYRCMHLPMLEARHFGSQVITAIDEAEEYFRRGFLIIVKRAAVPLGAMLCAGFGERLQMKLLGVANGSFDLTRAGVNAALNYFLIRHAFESGIKMVDFGLTGPFASDGVLKFKRKWGAIEVADRGIAVLCIRFKDEGAKQDFEARYAPCTLGSIEEIEPTGL